jgi:IclR family transcriptional regulator, KDG regulon repressor
MTVFVEPGRDDRAAVDKAISLLLAFGAQASTGLGVSELARRAQMSKSTAFRLLGALERTGVVERIGAGYRLGARLHTLGNSVYAPGHDRARDLLLPYVAELYELTRETVHLAVLHGTDVVYLAKLYGHRAPASPSRIGGRLPAHYTAVGKVLLAHDPDAAAITLSGPLPQATPKSIGRPEALAAELERIRTEGLAYDDEESRLGLACVAAPVFAPGGRVVAALSVSGPVSRVDLQRAARELRRVSFAATQATARARLSRTA